jgi:hypothetical protein
MVKSSAGNSVKQSNPCIQNFKHDVTFNLVGLIQVVIHALVVSHHMSKIRLNHVEAVAEAE